MAVYAAQVECMDRGIGRIMDALRRAGVADDTLVLFLSDNGGCAEFLAEDSAGPEPFRYNIPTADGRPMRVGNTPAVAPGPDDTFQSYDLPWANASNTPFRLFKHWVHEGGIGTPLVASWPRVIGRAGIVHQPVHVIDILPTLLEAAGVPLPERREGRPVTPVEGESFLPLLSGAPWQRDRPIFFEHEGNRAVRDGQWKLVSRHPGSWELYDMQRDRTELHDLAATPRRRSAAPGPHVRRLGAALRRGSLARTATPRSAMSLYGHSVKWKTMKTDTQASPAGRRFRTSTRKEVIRVSVKPEGYGAQREGRGPSQITVMPGYCSISPSGVRIGAPVVREVATMMRSAGSLCSRGSAVDRSAIRQSMAITWTSW